MPRIAIHFTRYGPYHYARLQAAHEVLSPLGWEVIGLETASTDATYEWDEAKGMNDGPKVVTAFPTRVHEEITTAEYRSTLFPLLDALAPTAMAIAGWGSTDAQLCLAWCRKNDVRRFVMSETRAADGKRVWWKELIKRYLISRFDGALVGGKSHRDYLIKLGMRADKIHFGYNVVDNAYFATETPKYRNTETPGLRPYFLASNRFIERKNLARLIEAYSSYIHSTFNIEHSTSVPWDLVLLGDGKLKPALIAQCHVLGLEVIESAPWEDKGNFECNQPAVYFPGFRQIDELPRFYAQAGCFIHPALEEPWGLVINEAMACGLPILSSRNVGAAEELVVDGVNGWNFDASNFEEMAAAMQRISGCDFPLSVFGDTSRIILQERCPTRAFGEGLTSLMK